MVRSRRTLTVFGLILQSSKALQKTNYKASNQVIRYCIGTDVDDL